MSHDHRSDSASSSSDDALASGHHRAGAGPTTSSRGPRTGAGSGLPFMEVQLQSEAAGGGLFDPMEMARTGSIEVATMFFIGATHSQRVELLEARRNTRDRLALLRAVPQDDMQRLLAGLSANAQMLLVIGDGLDDRLPPPVIAGILNGSQNRGPDGQPRLNVGQLLAVVPLLEPRPRAMVILGNVAGSTPVLNSLDDADLASVLQHSRMYAAAARSLVDEQPGHLRDRIRAAIKADPGLAVMMPIDDSTDADMAKSQTDPAKADLWNIESRDHGTKNVPGSSEWAQLPQHLRLVMFAAATIDKRVLYLDVEPESKGVLLRALEPTDKVETLLAFVKKYPRKRSVLADLKAADLIPALLAGADPAEAAALFLASSGPEQEQLGPVMTPLQVAGLFSVDDIEHTWVKGWSHVPDSLIAAAFLRMDRERLETLFFHAEDSAARMRAMLPAGHPLAGAAPGT